MKSIVKSKDVYETSIQKVSLYQVLSAYRYAINDMSNAESDY